MKKTLSVLFLGAAMIVPSVASADDETGRIRAVNSWSITLESGTFHMTPNSNLTKDLRPGDQVKVNYADTPDGRVATKVEKMGAN